MMLRATLLASLLGATVLAPAWAAEIEVTSFRGMTRLSIPIWSSDRWVSKKGRDAVKFSVDRGDLDLAPLSLDAEGRIRDLVIWRGDRESGFDLVLNCDCTVTSYPATDTMLFIDITEKPGPPPALTLGKPAMTVVPNDLNVTAEAPMQSIAALPPLAKVRAKPPAAMPPQPKPSAAELGREPATERVRTPAEPQDGESLRLSQVLVATPIPRPRPAAPHTTAEEDAEIERIRRAVLEQMADAADEGVIALNEGAGASRAKALDPSCPDEDELDLARLTEAHSTFRAPLGRLRAGVFDDMKQVSGANVRALARHYIAFGFGAEARNVLASFDVTGSSGRLILEMAAVIEGDGEALRGASLLHDGCGYHASLWRSAALSRTGDHAVVGAFAASGDSLSTVPGALRLVLGGRIALGLLDAGETGEAMRVWRMLEHAEGPPTSEMRLFSAYLPQISGDTAGTVSALLALAEDRTTVALAAALRAAKIAIDTDNRTYLDRLRASLDDLEFIYRDTSVEGELALAIAKLDARFGNLSAALARLDARAAVEPEKQANLLALRRALILSSAMRADPRHRPTEFATLIEEVRKLNPGKASDAARFAIAEAMIEAGAAHRVTEILPEGQARKSLKGRQLIAKASLLRGNATLAKTVIEGAADDESRRLLEDATRQSGLETRIAAEARFKEMSHSSPSAPIAGARALLDGAAEDAHVIEEILNDG